MSRLSELQLPIPAATETAAAHGVASDRCDILQDGPASKLCVSGPGHLDLLAEAVEVFRNSKDLGFHDRSRFFSG